MREFTLAGFIIRSSYRKNVFKLINSPVRPSEIAKKLGLRLTHVTRELRQLKKKGLIECLNPKERVGRLYQLTKKGESLKAKMKKKELL